MLGEPRPAALEQVDKGGPDLAKSLELGDVLLETGRPLRDLVGVLAHQHPLPVQVLDRQLGALRGWVTDESWERSAW